jgi:hypothetical protein
VCAIAVIARFRAPLFFGPPNLRTRRWNRACSLPRVQIAAQAAWTSSGLMYLPPSPVRPLLLLGALM